LLKIPLSYAQVWEPGPVFRCNTYTAGNQSDVRVALSETGAMVAVWDSYGQDGHINGIFGQSFDAAGTPYGLEFQVNEFTAEEQETPAVAMDGEGNFTVVWGGFGNAGGGIYARRYLPDGTPMGGEFKVSSFGFGIQNNPRIAMAPTGESIVTWTSAYQDGDGRGIIGQRLNSNGQPEGGEFVVNSLTAGHQLYPDVTMDESGNFIIAWLSQQGGGTGIYARKFHPTGTPQGADFQVSDNGSYHYRPSLSFIGDGEFVVTWATAPGPSAATDIMAKRYGANGVTPLESFQVNTYSDGQQSDPVIASDREGGFTIAWTSRLEDGDDDGIIARYFDGTGQSAAEPFQVNVHTPNDQRFAAIAANRAPALLLAWQSQLEDGDGWGVFARLYQDPATAMRETSTVLQPPVFPNPTPGEVTLSGYRGPVEVFDLLGSPLLYVRLTEENQVLSLASLPVGTYWLKTAHGTGAYRVQQVVVLR
jgi:hypothetical protein